jgi:hypothetical protein
MMTQKAARVLVDEAAAKRAGPGCGNRFSEVKIFRREVEDARSGEGAVFDGSIEAATFLP